MNQVVSFERIIYFGYIQEQAKDPNAFPLSPKSSKKADLAFGTRVKESAKTLKLPGITSS